MNKLKELETAVEKSEFRIVLVQIQEAHSKKWPLGLPDHPDIHYNINDRIERAKEFIDKYGLNYRILVDPWGDPFENTFQCWPDQYYIITPEKKIMKKSEYSLDACIIDDYADYLYINIKQ